MAAKLYYSPFIPAFSSNGLPVPNARLFFFYSGTDTLAPIFTDTALVTPMVNPVVSDLAARFDPVYLDESVTYRVRLVDSLGIQLGDDIDPYIPGQALRGDPGPAGPANNTRSNLAALKAANTSDVSSIYDGSLWYWTLGSFTSLVDDVNYVKANSTPIATGAWVRQRSTSVPFRQAGTGARSRSSEDKMRETVTVLDFGAGPDLVAPMTAALAAAGTTSPARVVISKGSWTIGGNVDWSPYRNVTLDFSPEAVVNQGSSVVILPERVVSNGKTFTGLGSVTQRNKDQTPLVTPGGGHVVAGNDPRGVGAFRSNIGGFSNFAYGVNALAKAQYVRTSIAFGNGASQSVVGDSTGARKLVNGSTEILSYFAAGDATVAIGDTVLRDNLTGTECIGIGVNSLQMQTAGDCNIAVGANSQITNLTASFNVSLGGYCLVTNQSDNNIAIGWAALEGQTTGSNIAIGHANMNGNKTGTSNVSIGVLGLQKAMAPVESVVIGQEVAKNVTGFMNGVAIGAFAVGSTVGAPVNTTAVGRNALLNVTADECTAIGSGALSTNITYSNCTGVGLNSAVTGNNQVQLGDSRTVVYAYSAVNIRSDGRDKTDVRDTILGLDFVNSLRPVDYRLDLRDDYRVGDEPIGAIVPDGSKKRSRYHHGVIAQEVKAVIDESGVDFGGFQDHSIGGGDTVMSIGYEELIAPLIKAVQELSAKVVALEARLDAE